MEAVEAEGAKPGLGPAQDAARKRAAVETYARHEPVLRRTARRYSLCADDADDALQRGLEILLGKAPTLDPRELVKWMQTVVKHEALAIRRDRERMLAGPPAMAREPDGEDWIAMLPSRSVGPQERLERSEEIARSREALQALKPQELRALTLLAEGYSYAEIGEITSWSQTKINRCIAEGRERFRNLIARSEDGSRCAEMRPLLSRFCDGEAGSGETAELREHLRACASCRATLRAYRAAPAAAAALAPTLPLHSSLWERVQEAVADATSRFSGRGGEAASQAAAAGGGGALGLAKVAALCVGTAGSAAACVLTGLVPAPLGLGGDRQPDPARQHHERRLADMPQPEPAAVNPAPAPPSDPETTQGPEPAQSAEAPAEAEPVAAEPAPVSGEAVEATPAPAPEPVAEPAPTTSSGGGSPAGEFGP